jgi:hypothetical protein
MPLEFDGVNGIIKNSTSDGDVTIKGNDGGSEISALTFDMSDAGTATFNHDVKLGDNSKAFFGDDSDFEIYHSGTASIIREASAGNLTLAGNDVQITNGAMNETHIDCNNNGSVDLYYDNTKKFLTSSTGINLPVDGDSIKFGADSEVLLTHVHNAGLALSSAGNLDTLSLISTDADANVGPNLRLYRNSSSPADNDALGYIEFEGRNDNSQDVIYGSLEATLLDASDGTEDGELVMRTMIAGTKTNQLMLKPEGFIFNENSADLDFRVESNNKTHALFVDGGNDRIAVGTDSPVQTMHIRSMGNPSNDTGLILEGNSTDANVALYFYNSAGSERGRLLYDTDDNNLQVKVNTSEVMRFHSGGNVSIGTTSDDGKVTIATSDSTAGPNSDADELFLESNGNAGLTIGSSTSTSGNIHFADNGAANRGIITYDHGADEMKFGTSGAIKMRLNSSGEFMVGKSSSGIANAGVELFTDKLSATVSAATIMYLNRLTNDGTIAQFHQAGTEEGSIEVSGSTVSYNGFTGSHWSRLADNSKPTILRGTIMESIDEMCDWYQAVAEVPAILWTAEDKETQDTLWTEDNTLPDDVEVGDVRWAATQTVGDVKEAAYTVKESIALGSKSVGDAITFTSEGTEFTGTIVKEDDIKHNKCKVSDTADSKKVYGVFSNWDDADDGLDGDVNDMNIAQVGTFIIRVHKDVTVEAGDLLVSNGDGTAKKQDDDIIRSKTVAKVNSNIKVETYSDGSYTVPCTLHC